MPTAFGMRGSPQIWGTAFPAGHHRLPVMRASGIKLAGSGRKREPRRVWIEAKTANLDTCLGRSIRMLANPSVCKMQASADTRLWPLRRCP